MFKKYLLAILLVFTPFFVHAAKTQSTKTQSVQDEQRKKGASKRRERGHKESKRHRKDRRKHQQEESFEHRDTEMEGPQNQEDRQSQERNWEYLGLRSDSYVPMEGIPTGSEKPTEQYYPEYQGSYDLETHIGSEGEYLSGSEYADTDILEGQIPSLNSLMRSRILLAGVVGSYRLNHESAVDVSCFTSFLNWHTVPSVGYKRIFPQRLKKYILYWKGGIGIPFAYFPPELNDQQSRIDAWRHEVSSDRGKEEPESGWEWGVGAIVSGGLLYPMNSNMSFDISLNMIQPFTSTSPESCLGLIGSIQVGVCFQLR